MIPLNRHNLNDNNNDACTTECTTAVCGDGYKQPLEECDDGNEVNTDFCTNECTSVVCGDGYKQPGEECDDGNMLNTDTCTNVCKLSKCGDGYLQPGEQCDDGNPVSTDSCTSVCKLPVCGDGYVWNGVEECDDGNPKNYDGCNISCKREGIVFVTSQTFSGDLNGLDGADAKCQDAAMAAGLTGQFKAWVGTGSLYPENRFIAYEGVYRRTDGQIIANSWDDLVDGSLIKPIQYDEYGAKITSGNVWTNVDFDGGWVSDEHCGFWDNTLQLSFPYFGNLTSTAASWTKFGNDKNCSTKLHLYCFAQGGD